MNDQSKKQLEAEINECNEECQSCQNSFQKEGIPFSPSCCRYCDNGRKLHQLLTKVSKGEEQWDSVDWNSCKYEEFYNG